ncbi:hypothetical protein SALBM311S_03555 [Streptomyces alboniger]
MTHLLAVPSLLSAIEPVHLVAAVGVLALVLGGWSIRRNRTRASGPRAGNPAVWVAALAALNCTAYSADTSWRFAADYLDMAGALERAMMFSAAELALFATALMARQNLKTQGAPGLPGGLVWVITGVQVIPAYAESGTVGGTVRAFVGPVMAAVLWHLAMGIELRLHKPDAASQGLLATLGREVRERLLSRLGVATRNRDAAQITKDRATQRAVALASRLAGIPEKEREDGRGSRITRRLQSALARSGVGTDPQQRRALLEQLAARRHATALATVVLPSPWIQLARDQDADHGDRSPFPTSIATPSANGTQASAWVSSVPGDGPRSTASIGDRTEGDRAEPGTAVSPSGTVPTRTPSATRTEPPSPARVCYARAKRRQSGTKTPVPAGAEEPDDGASGSAANVREARAAGHGGPRCRRPDLPACGRLPPALPGRRASGRMIPKVHDMGTDTRGLVAYLYGPGKAEEHIDPHLVAAWDRLAPDPGRDPKATYGDVQRLLDQPVMALPESARPAEHVWHLSVRAAPEDPILTDEQWADIARRMVAATGIAPEGDDAACRWAAVRHADDHIHIIATVVRHDGRQARIRHDGARSQAEARKIEVDYGLRAVEHRRRNRRQAPHQRRTP